MPLPEIANYPAVYRFRFCPLCGAELEKRWDGERSRLTCPQDGWKFSPQPALAAAVVVEYLGGVLLLRRAIKPDVGIWHLPHGHLEYGELPADGAARETHEETGLTLDDLSFLDYEYSPSYSDPELYYLVFCFRARGSGEPRLNAENTDLQVFPPDAIPEMKWTSHRRAIAAWQAGRYGRPWTPGQPL